MCYSDLSGGGGTPCGRRIQRHHRSGDRAQTSVPQRTSPSRQSRQQEYTMEAQRPDRCSGRESHRSGGSRVVGKKQQVLVVGWKAEARVAYEFGCCNCVCGMQETSGVGWPAPKREVGIGAVGVSNRGSAEAGTLGAPSSVRTAKQQRKQEGALVQGHAQSAIL